MIQSTLDFNRRERDKGIQKAVSSAERVAPGWAEECYKFFQVFLQHRVGSFQSEDFELFARNVLPPPPSLRAYGGVIQKAARKGLIKKVGIGPVSRKSSHLANASIWVKV